MNELFANNESAIVASDRVLYTASSFARSSLLHLQEIGLLRALKPHTSSRSNLQSYLFFIVEDGSGELTYDRRTYQLKKGSCVFIDCRKSYSHSTVEADLWTLRWIHFNGPSMSNVYQKYCERGGHPVFEPDDFASFFSIIESVINVAQSSDYMRDMKINQYLSELMVYVMAESWHPEDRVMPNKKVDVLEIKKYLDENYKSKITLDDLSARFFISKHYLTHSFKEQYGQGVTAYLLSVRITQAKQLLRFSSKTIEKIGYEVGIGAPHYFSRVFKEVEGVPPAVYRKQW